MKKVLASLFVAAAFTNVAYADHGKCKSGAYIGAAAGFAKAGLKLRADKDDNKNFLAAYFPGATGKDDKFGPRTSANAFVIQGHVGYRHNFGGFGAFIEAYGGYSSEELDLILGKKEVNFAEQRFNGGIQAGLGGWLSASTFAYAGGGVEFASYKFFKDSTSPKSLEDNKTMIAPKAIVGIETSLNNDGSVRGFLQAEYLFPIDRKINEISYEKQILPDRIGTVTVKGTLEPRLDALRVLAGVRYVF